MYTGARFSWEFVAVKRELSVFDRHALKIARDTLKMSDMGALIMGGPTKEQARETIKRITGKEPKES